MSMLSTAPVPATRQPGREITMSQAIREALAEELRRDPTVFIIGEDVAEAGLVPRVPVGQRGQGGLRRAGGRGLLVAAREGVASIKLAV